MIEVARVRGDEYYRVLVGPEQNRDRAQRLVGQLKRESYIHGDPFLRVVK
ncbi:MAG: SPOR domain-containing protein [Deltaproteobacteria bacterium]|nr:SPOR domain-containing protein [Deltaproteobacteria bacterium]